MKKLGLRGKLILLVAGLLVVIFGVSAYYVSSDSAKQLRADLLSRSEAFAALATDPIGNNYTLYKDSGTILIQAKIDDFTKLETSIKNVSVVDLTGKSLYSQHAGLEPTITSDQASSFETIIQKNPSGVVQYIVSPFIETFGIHRYAVVYSISSATVDAAIRTQVLSLLAFNIIALLVAIALMYTSLNRSIIRPIRLVSEQATEVSGGDYDRDISIEGGGEVAALASSVNSMADALKADITKLQETDRLKSEFLMITSHNIRTPLTIISSYLDSIASFKTVEELKVVLQNIANAAKRLGVFAEDVLTISRLESGDLLNLHDPISLTDLMTTIVEDFKPLAKEKAVEFSPAITNEDIQLIASKPLIRAAVFNVLDNALKFSEEAGTIKLSLDKVDDKSKIVVSDTGTGISPEEMPKLFTKFHRGTSTLNYDYEGTGIGLYATKLIIDRHKGSIKIDSQLGKGTTVTILLPINSQ